MIRRVRMMPGILACVTLVVGTLAAGCGSPAEKPAPPPESAASAPKAEGAASAASPLPAALAGTEWRLVAFQSMDDAQGTERPSDPSLYTMSLHADGSVAMRLNCNRATGTWQAQAGPEGTSGQFSFGPLAATMALCPPPSMDERVTSQASYVRSYLLKDGKLYLSLMADGGIFEWEPLEESPFQTEPDKAIEAAILKASPSYTKAAVDLEGGTGRGRYVYGRVDLNGDGRDEVFAYLLGSIFCGTGGCNLQLFTDAPDGYRLVNDFPISRLPVIVSSQQSGGWSDLYRLEFGGGAPASYVRHTFDGTRYVERERMPAGQAPAGKRYLAGELTFQKGIPLEPVK